MMQRNERYLSVDCRVVLCFSRSVQVEAMAEMTGLKVGVVNVAYTWQ